MPSTLVQVTLNNKANASYYNVGNDLMPSTTEVHTCVGDFSKLVMFSPPDYDFVTLPIAFLGGLFALTILLKTSLS